MQLLNGEGGERHGADPLESRDGADESPIRASVPGFSPDEVSVTVDQGILTIDARHREEKEKKEKNCVRQERFSGRLYRQIALGQDVTGDQANATFANGVLTVTVPLAARSEPRKIPVQAAKT
jgi:HSP20 family protein